jgi:hypothetical protein
LPEANSPSVNHQLRLNRLKQRPAGIGCVEVRTALFFERSQRLSVTTCGSILRDGKYRRGGYIFITWKSDHPPRHVHVYRDDRLIVKWDLDNQKPMKGAITRILELIVELESEGQL